jgi:photosystem II stability/assembly factor-like uncharacterized protein
MIIENGVGNGSKLKVDSNNRAHTQSVTESESLHASELGDAYNINTGNIALTGDGTLLYLKNNEDKDLVIEAIAFGNDGLGTHSSNPRYTIVRNPDGGDVISDASAVSMNANRNFGSNKTLVTDAYKGKVSGTMTGGADIAILEGTSDGRDYFSINFVLPKGSSIGIKVTANLSSGTAGYYAAIIAFLKDPEGTDK